MQECVNNENNFDFTGPNIDIKRYSKCNLLGRDNDNVIVKRLSWNQAHCLTLWRLNLRNCSTLMSVLHDDVQNG